MWVGTRREFNGFVIGGIAMMITKNFSVAEMECHCGCGDAEMDGDFMKILQHIREEMQRPLQITSGARCSRWNEQVSSTGKSGPHVFRKAADILISGADAMRLFDIARKHGISGIGLSQKGTHGKRFVHLDILSADDGHPRPTVWTY